MEAVFITNPLCYKNIHNYATIWHLASSGQPECWSSSSDPKSAKRRVLLLVSQLRVALQALHRISERTTPEA